jgi:hypothetical protein
MEAVRDVSSLCVGGGEKCREVCAWRSLGKQIGKAITNSWVHKRPYPSLLALKGFFAQSQTHLVVPAGGASIIFAVPLHPIKALVLPMPAHAVGSDLTGADTRRKRDRSRFSKTATHVTGDTRVLPVANLRTIDVAELLKITEGTP